MMKNIVSLLVATLAASLSVSASSDGLVRIGRADPTSNVVMADANLNGNGISSSFKFLPTEDNKGLQVIISASGLGQGNKYPFHIHEKVVPSDGNCTGTGGHLDPFKIKATAGDNYKCDSTKPDTTCELGDLAGIFGAMEADANGSYSGNFKGTVLSFSGDSSILGHSIVIHAPDASRLACANITGYVLSNTGGSANTDKPSDDMDMDMSSGDDTSMDMGASHEGMNQSESESSTKSGASSVGVASAMAIMAAAFWL
ncbi:Superoxide dismutase [Coemansia sp. RSA 1286]|nr:Superoxide dismutase [Coemansia sp. RSA 1721]KAJ2639066.1 Superoxide dismutase [Coemansia sp. RSA 1286]